MERDVFLSIGVSASEDDLHKIALAHDKKKSGKVNYEEFLKGNKYVSKVMISGDLLIIEIRTA